MNKKGKTMNAIRKYLQNLIVGYSTKRRDKHPLQIIREPFERRLLDLTRGGEPTELRMVAIQTVNYCSRSCWWCPRRTMPQNPSQIMSRSLFKKIVNELRDFSGLFCIGIQCDAFECSDVVWQLQYAVANAPKMRIQIPTHGRALTQKILDLIDLSRIEIYVNTYGDKGVMEKIKNFKGLAGVSHHKRPPDIRNMARMPSRFKLPLKQGCLYPFFCLTIMADGSAVQCFDDLAKDNVLGDINRLTIQEIWQSPKLQTLRGNLKNNVRSGLCAKCDYHGISTFIT